MWSSLANFADGSPVNLWIQDTYWLWPVMEITHFLGLSLLFGGLLVVDLRMAGHIKGVTPSSTYKLLPLVLVGFTLNLITGVLFFFGDPARYSINIGFQLKMVLITIAGLNALFYHWRVSPSIVTWDETNEPPKLAKFVAYVSLTCWFGVLLSGRLIPYVGTG
ncbi:MAG TPA: hypothetical protein DEF79_11520 [Gammaproteobacteria bacterium]|nr:hypothetical protein [Gammaproteobacteria bacterium]|tara:strand:- start:3975 stop:4463 length:489 start_codon:yes stop_codon:yes gene_type:complete